MHQDRSANDESPIDRLFGIIIGKETHEKARIDGVAGLISLHSALPIMGMGVTVYGYIATPFIIEGYLDNYRHNRMAIRDIPADDPNKLITRGMFNVPRYRPGKFASIPHYDA